MKIRATFHPEVHIEDSEVRKIVIGGVENLLNHSNYEWFSIVDGNLIGNEDFRGSNYERVLRPATELDKAIVLVLKKLKETK